jgi:hypothetical protein
LLKPIEATEAHEAEIAEEDPDNELAQDWWLAELSE